MRAANVMTTATTRGVREARTGGREGAGGGGGGPALGAPLPPDPGNEAPRMILVYSLGPDGTRGPVDGDREGGGGMGGAPEGPVAAASCSPEESPPSLSRSR